MKKAASLRVLAFVVDDEVRSALQLILSHSTWIIEAVTTFDDAVRVLHGSGIGVVVTQHWLCGRLCWKDLLDQTQRLNPAPRLIVTDPLADEDLWVEVLKHGGYDVLAQPLDSREVFRVLSLAWRSWNEEKNARAESIGRRGRLSV